MVDFAEPRVVRPAHPRDLPGLRARLTNGPPEKHSERLERQAMGGAVYLVAVQGDEPIGHALLKWDGRLFATPEVEDLFVHPDHRRRGVAGRLLAEAERLAAAEGYTGVGLGCGVDNLGARALYDGRGYADAGLGVFHESGRWTDPDGVERSWEEDCVYLVRQLASAAATGAPGAVSEPSGTTIPEGEGRAMSAGAAEEAEGQQDAPREGAAAEDTTAATGAAAEGPAEETGTPEGAQAAAVEAPRPLGDRVLDFTLGAAILTAETVDRLVNGAVETAKTVQQNAPAILQAIEEKGRPARERLLRSLREETHAGAAGAESEGPADEAGTDRTRRAASAVASAEDEIRILEERVMALEREISVGAAPSAPAGAVPPVLTEVAPSVVNDPVPDPAREGGLPQGIAPGVGHGYEEPPAPDPAAEVRVAAEPETTAEASTFVTDFSPETPVPTALADSPYAISETEEQQEAEADEPAAALGSVETQAPVEDEGDTPGDATPPAKSSRSRRGKSARSEQSPGASDEAQAGFDPENPATDGSEGPHG